MRPEIFRFLPLLAALALCGCESVTSKTPVGDAGPPLDPKVWNGKWQYGQNQQVASSRIIDARRGIVELKILTPWTKPNPDDTQPLSLEVRRLGAEWIANSFDSGSYSFERVVFAGDAVVTFQADKTVFSKLIRGHKIAGKLTRDQNGKPTGDCVIDGLSGRDYDRLKKEGVEVRTLFEENSSRVFVRSHGLW